MKEGDSVFLSYRIQKHDTIVVIAPAGPSNQKNLHQSLTFLEELGLNVKLGRYVDSKYGYLAGTDDERLHDFHEMIEIPKIQGIFFARGGYGTGRIAANIDYELIKQYTKIIWGYSDITYLHTTMR